MVTTTTSQINFDRTQIEAIVKDPQSVFQFENLITALNNASNTIQTIDNSTSTANEAITRIELLASQIPTFPPPFDPSPLLDRIEGLERAPVYTPELKSGRYGAFYDTTSQTAAATGTAYTVTWGNTAYANGFAVGTPTSRITVDKPGLYAYQLSGQLSKASAATANVWYWSRLNGTDITASASQVTLAGSGAAAHVMDTFLIQMNAGDYVEFAWATDDTGCQWTTTAASSPVPQIPSLTLSIYARDQ